VSVACPHVDDARRLVEDAVRALVREPEAVRVDAVAVAPGLMLLAISTAPSDIGRAIGAGGATIKTLRALVAGYGRREGLRLLVDVAGSRTERHPG
jgi:predicted RNA-binding protein YlqC (UPF0109 family)